MLSAKLFYINKPPTDVGQFRVLSDAVDAAAENIDWVTALGADAPKGECWLTLEALSQDIYVRFKGTATAAGTTANNGRIIKAGAPGVSFYVGSTSHRYIDAIAAAAGGTLKYQVSSPIGSRSTQ
jgi:hypothetical protein